MERFISNDLITAMRFLAIACCAMLLGACSTTYHAPDAKKLNAAAVKLQKSIDRSHDTAAKAKAKHQEVEKEANAALLDSLDIDKKLDELAKQAPPELQPLVKAVQDVRKDQKTHEDNLQIRVEEERILHEQLAKDNQAVTADRIDYDKESKNYQREAAVVAATATEDNKKLSSQLWKQKLLSALGVTGAIVLVVALVGGLILWKLGKLAIKF